MLTTPQVTRKQWQSSDLVVNSNESEYIESIMAKHDLTAEQLSAFLDEALSPEQMAVVEKELRKSEDLRQRLSTICRRRDLGLHSVGEIWRRHRLSCPSRQQLGSYLLATMDENLAAYIDFHIRTIACRLCAANLVDLEEQNVAAGESTTRRRKFFQSSAGLLPK